MTAMEVIARERRTEQRLRALDMHEIVDRVHFLEDCLSRTEDELWSLRRAFRHTHVNNQSVDTCATCGLDLRNPIHRRASQ